MIEQIMIFFMIIMAFLFVMGLYQVFTSPKFDSGKRVMLFTALASIGYLISLIF